VSRVRVFVKSMVEHRGVAVGWLMTIAVASIALWGLLGVATDTSEAKSPAVIACFHPESGRFTGVAHPRKCVVKGYRGFGRHFVSVPVAGIVWGHWGASPTRGAFGNRVSTGEGVRLIAYRRHICDDGRYWYSRVIVNFRRSGIFYELRLPTCNSPLVVG
jgi:hypothetical protein